MGYPMTCRSGSTLAFSAVLILLSFSAQASAADLPPVKITDENKVPACVTPGRLLAYLKNRNDKLDPKFEAMPTEYMRHGEALGLRWDYAFFQAMLETGYLKFTGDVKPDQNNFAGLGATGRGVRGESFKDVSSGRARPPRAPARCTRARELQTRSPSARATFRSGAFSPSGRRPSLDP